MVHYIRFLKTPQVSEIPKKGLTLAAVATITTDLGDAFLCQDTEFLVSVVDATRSGERLVENKLIWHDGDRAAKIHLQCSTKLVARLVRVHITTQSTQSTVAKFQIPQIVDVWSEPFTLKNGARTEPVVAREVALSGKCIVRQWEETGDSIARHIWDASLGFLILFQHIFLSPTKEYLPNFKQQTLEFPATKVRVLEVGAGCGIVGIALSQLRKLEIFLTDLEDAQDILQSNVETARPVAGSTVKRQILGWGPSTDMLLQSRFDLVLVSDCIYNPDSSLLLVETLLQVSRHNAKVSILVGFKRRHDADDVFFERMNAAGFTVAEACEILLPHTMTEYDAAEPKIEMFVYTAPPPA